MTITTLKKRISKAIEHIEDEIFLQAIYTIVSNNQVGNYELPDDELQILDQRRKKYLSGKAKTYSASDVRKKALKKLPKK